VGGVKVLTDTPLSAEQALAAGRAAGAEYAVFGWVRLAKGPPGEGPVAGMKLVQLDVALHATRINDGQVVGQGLAVSKPMASPISVDAKALSWAEEAAEEALVRDVLGDRAARGAQGGELELRVGTDDYGLLQAFEEGCRQVRGVGEVEELGYEGGQARLRLVAPPPGTPEALGKALSAQPVGGAQVQVVKATASALELTLQR
jgi:hypothetical protein